VRRLRALLFDLDGTLIDSAEANHAAYSRALLEFGVRIEPDAVARAAAGRQWRDFLPALLRDAGVERDPEAIASRKGQLYRAAVGELRVNVALLALASSVGPELRTALVTTASGESVRAILHHPDLSHAFDHVVTGDDVTRHKPDPEAYLLALERLQLDPRECLAFEDSDVGVASAEAAGIAVVRVTFSA
jgi:beta-phosphoglucomutase-like phosphatase (HAD superfamily)